MSDEREGQGTNKKGRLMGGLKIRGKAMDNNRDDLRDGLTIEEGLITNEQAVTIIMNQFEYDREEAETFLKELAAKNPERCIWLN